jgi:hypothetical protein
LHEKTIERIKACRKANFPICLNCAIEAMFPRKELIFALAKKAGYKSREGSSSSEDIWQTYLEFLSALEIALGRDAVAVIESRVVHEIEAMEESDCPIYELELKRKENNYRDPLLLTIEGQDL